MFANQLLIADPHTHCQVDVIELFESILKVLPSPHVIYYS